MDVQKVQGEYDTDRMTIWDELSDVDFDPLNAHREPTSTLVGHGANVIDKRNGTRGYEHVLDETSQSHTGH